MGPLAIRCGRPSGGSWWLFAGGSPTESNERLTVPTNIRGDSHVIAHGAITCEWLTLDTEAWKRIHWLCVLLEWHLHQMEVDVLCQLPIRRMNPGFYTATPSTVHHLFVVTYRFSSQSDTDPRCCKLCHFRLFPTCFCECNLQFLNKVFVFNATLCWPVCSLHFYAS